MKHLWSRWAEALACLDVKSQKESPKQTFHVPGLAQGMAHAGILPEDSLGLYLS